MPPYPTAHTIYAPKYPSTNCPSHTFGFSILKESILSFSPRFSIKSLLNSIPESSICPMHSLRSLAVILTRIFVWVLLFHLLMTGSSDGLALAEDYSEPALDANETAAVYRVLEAINPETDWKTSYAGNLCTDGPHGIVCDVDKDDGHWHIVELNLGWVSDYANNPLCSNNASFSPSILLFSHLRKLFFYKCFTHSKIAIPSYVWTLGNRLQELVFQDNPALHGVLPSGLGNLVGLRRLILSGTSIGGAIPDEIGHLKEIQQLCLSGNGLNGSISGNIGELENLVILDLSRNQLVGSVPAEFGGLKKLSKIDLSFNNLSGAVPDSFGQMDSLEMMDLSVNRFSGGIPLFISGMPRLRDIHLSGNPIGGLIPDFWDKLSGLVSLGLSRAGLVGGIPDSICSLKSLTYLALDNNRLVGTIPRQFGSLPSIYHMDLSGNQLTGLVPFSADFIERLGSKLQLADNSGLCFSPDVGGQDLLRFNLNSCDSTALSESFVQDNYEPIINSGSVMDNPIHRAWLSLLLLLFWLLFM